MAIELRSVLQSDKSVFFEWINNRSLVINSSAYFPTSEEDHNKWFESITRKRSDRAFLVIEDTECKSVIGYCQLLNIHQVHRTAELQIRIGNQQKQGKGYGTSAVMKLLNFGYMDLGLERIYLHVFANNNRAIHVYEKCGFVKEGVLRSAYFIDGKRHDCLIMSTLKNEYDS